MCTKVSISRTIFLVSEVINRSTGRPYVTGTPAHLVGVPTLLWVGNDRAPVTFQVVDFFGRGTEVYYHSSPVEGIYRFIVNEALEEDYFKIVTKNSIYTLIPIKSNPQTTTLH